MIRIGINQCHDSKNTLLYLYMSVALRCVVLGLVESINVQR